MFTVVLISILFSFVRLKLDNSFLSHLGLALWTESEILTPSIWNSLYLIFTHSYLHQFPRTTRIQLSFYMSSAFQYSTKTISWTQEIELRIKWSIYLASEAKLFVFLISVHRDADSDDPVEILLKRFHILCLDPNPIHFELFSPINLQSFISYQTFFHQTSVC